MTHTPGPWKMALFIDSPNEAFVQWPYGYAAVHGSRTGREANARLIAAAPELLAALQGIIAAVERGDALRSGVDEFELAVATVAKATNEEHQP